MHLQWHCPSYLMMTSWNGNIFRVMVLYAGNSPVTGEFPSQRPVARSFDVFFDLRLNKRLSKQSGRRWFETPSRSLWRHCNGIDKNWLAWCPDTKYCISGSPKHISMHFQWHYPSYLLYKMYMRLEFFSNMPLFPGANELTPIFTPFVRFEPITANMSLGTLLNRGRPVATPLNGHFHVYG